MNAAHITVAGSTTALLAQVIFHYMPSPDQTTAAAIAGLLMGASALFIRFLQQKGKLS